MLAGGKPESLSNILVRTEEGQEQRVEMEQAHPVTHGLYSKAVILLTDVLQFTAGGAVGESLGYMPHKSH